MAFNPEILDNDTFQNKSIHENNLFWFMRIFVKLYKDYIKVRMFIAYK